MLCLSMHKIWPLASRRWASCVGSTVPTHSGRRLWQRNPPCSFRAISIAILVMTVPTTPPMLIRSRARALQWRKSGHRVVNLTVFIWPSSEGGGLDHRRCRGRLHTTHLYLCGAVQTRLPGCLGIRIAPHFRDI